MKKVKFIDDKVIYICLLIILISSITITIISVFKIEECNRYKSKYKEYKEYYEIAMTKYETLQVNYDDLESDYQIKLYHLRKDCRGE